jgi:hypothetical protein
VTTSKELANELAVGVSEVKKLLREANPGIDYKSPDRSLTAEEELLVRTGMQAHLERKRSRSGEVAAPPPAVELPARLELPFVAPMAGAGRPRAGRGHRLLLHEDVLAFLQDDRGELRRLQAAVQRLMREMLVEGRAQRRVKGTRGANAGWLRAPLGDNGGHHYYLWHALAGMKPVVGLALERDEVLVRAVRHHDDTDDALGAGARGDYLTLDAADYIGMVEVAGAADVLSREQRQACEHTSALTIGKGHPGAGKTTLQLERTRRYHGRILFVTFGEAQRDQARRWLDTYAHAEQETVAWTHQQLFQALDPDWRPAPPLATAAARLQAALAADPRALGPWAGHPGALYAELRAHLWGRSLPFPFRGHPAVLDDELAARAYRARRADKIGAAAAQAAIQAARLLAPEVRALLFGDLDRAHRIAATLADDGELPTPLAGVEAIFVDEIQDLTLVEQLVCALIARGRARGGTRQAALHVAGDEGQTVRATDFDWGELKDLIHELLGRPEEFELPGNVRSPSTITLVINNSWALYKTVAKRQRPKGYAEAQVDETALGSVLWVDAEGGLDALCAVVAATPGAALVYPDTRLPDDVREAATRAGVVHAAAAPEIKGLDFRVAFVLDVGRRAHELYTTSGTADEAAIIELENRTAVDAIRVAISRATEVLVLAERDLGKDERARLAMLCAQQGGMIEGVVPGVPLAELSARLDIDTADRSAMVSEALVDFDRTFADDPETGLRIAERARGWLGESNRAAAVQGELRRQVYRALGQALLRAAIDREDDAVALFTRAGAELRNAREAELAALALEARAILTGEPTRAQLASVAAQAGGEPGLVTRYAGLVLDRVVRRAGAAAATLDGKGWDRVLDMLEASAAYGRVSPAHGSLRAELAERACEWALAQPMGKAHEQRAARALALLPSPPPLLRGRVAERRGQWDDALACYREAAAPTDALRIARAHGDDIDLALELARAAASPTVETLERLARIHRDLVALPTDALTDHERGRLAQLVKDRFPLRRR